MLELHCRQYGFDIDIIPTSRASPTIGTATRTRIRSNEHDRSQSPVVNCWRPQASICLSSNSWVCDATPQRVDAPATGALIAGINCYQRRLSPTEVSNHKLIAPSKHIHIHLQTENACITSPSSQSTNSAFGSSGDICHPCYFFIVIGAILL